MDAHQRADLDLEFADFHGIRLIRELPNGLADRAIMAARRLRFLPATKDGRPVNMYIQLEYNFNLY